MILGFQDTIWNLIRFKVVYMEIREKLTDGHQHGVSYHPERSQSGWWPRHLLSKMEDFWAWMGPY